MLCTSLMVIFDDLMVKGVYANAKNAVVTTCVLGSIFGIIVSFGLWGLYGFDQHWSNLQSWFWPYGLMIIGSGVALSQFMLQYFRCFYEDLDGTMVASWIAATPIFVYIAAAVLFLTNVTAELTPFTFEAAAGVTVASFGVILLERLSSEDGKRTGHRGPMIWLMIFSIIYILSVDWTLGEVAVVEVTEAEAVRTLMPLYWLGFAFGAWPALQRSMRASFKSRWKKIRLFGIPILILELIGMFAFFLEFFGIGETDPVLVQIIYATSPVAVWFTSIRITKLARSLDLQGQSRTKILFMRVKRVDLRNFELESADRLKQISFVLVTMTGVAIFLYATN